jgi:hypothetical protein
LSSRVGKKELGAFQMVGSLAVSVDDIAYQLIVYMDLLPKQARWQAELVMADSDNKTGIKSGIASLNDLEAAVSRMSPVVEQAPEIMAGQRDFVLKTLRQERLTVLANIDQQRLDTLAYLTRERLAAADDIKSMERTFAEILKSEREAVLKSIDAQRSALMAEIESAENRIADNAGNLAEQVIDHFFIRALQLVAVLLLLGAGAAVVVWYFKRG